MENIEHKVQKYLAEEYRKAHPDLDGYTDEELALMNPATEDDIIAYETYEKHEKIHSDRVRLILALERINAAIAYFKEDIEASNEIIADSKVFGGAKTEARGDIVYAEVQIENLELEKKKVLAELEKLDRDNNETRSR